VRRSHFVQDAGRGSIGMPPSPESETPPRKGERGGALKAEASKSAAPTAREEAAIFQIGTSYGF
jgi:hypothetical protein